MSIRIDGIVTKNEILFDVPYNIEADKLKWQLRGFSERGFRHTIWQGTYRQKGYLISYHLSSCKGETDLSFS